MSARQDDIVDVIVPVYNNVDDTNRLFESLIAASNSTRIALQIVDDASPDIEGLRIPSETERIPEVSFVRNDPNKGFAGSVNRGFEASRRDAVILNTDTLVFGDWLDRLRAAAAGKRVATATPFSNAATILCYPTFPFDFQETLETPWAELDALCKDLGTGPVEIPTGIGFCMLIKRDCLDAIGGFDVEAFGSGYGEESDFCRRAVKAGWTNVAAPNVFVWHRGSGSFGARTLMLRAAAEERLRARHPDYADVVSRFIKTDPLRLPRMRLDFARLNRLYPAPRLAVRAGVDGLEPGTLAFEKGRRLWPKVWRPRATGMGPLPNLPRLTRFSRDATIRRFLQDAKVSEIISQGDGSLPRALVAKIDSVAEKLGIPHGSARG